VLGILAACSGGDADLADDESALTPLEPEPDDAITRAEWQTLGLGVSYKSIDTGGGAQGNALLVYGGYLAADEYVQRWADELARVQGMQLGVAHLYAIKGPNQSGYANREIQNTKLAAHLGTDHRAERASSLIVIAHSSGTFVAEELLEFVRDGRGGVPADTIGKVELFNLDGGGVSSSALLHQLAHSYFVYACDSAIDRCSRNSDSMRSLGQQYASLGGAFKVNATGSGCSRDDAGGLWCLHDTVITTLPHNPVNYDLRRDYTDFTNGRRLVTSYLDVLSSLSSGVSAME
jgi:hypothetical protein